VTAQDADAKLDFDVAPSDLSLPPGASGSSHVNVWPHNPKEPRAGRRLQFQVLVQPVAGTPVRLDGTTVLLERKRGWWPKWRLAIAAAVLLTLLTGGVALAGPPYPHWPPLPVEPSPSPSPSASPKAPLAPLVAKLSVSTPSLKFGTVQVGAGSAAIPFTVANSGTGKAQVTAKLSNSKDFTIQDLCAGSPLEPNTQCQVQIAYTPQAEGAMDATVSFTVDSGNPPAPVALSGVGQGHAILSCVPASVSLNISVDRRVINATPPTTTSQSMTCTNSGTGAMTVSSVVLQDTTGKFSMQAADCSGKTLKPINGCTIQLSFNTSTFGPTFNASILINSSLGQQIVPVSGLRDYASSYVTVCPACRFLASPP
jgi:hypothetical protein